MYCNYRNAAIKIQSAPPKDGFSGCFRFGTIKCEVMQDAIQQRQQLENGISESGLSCCFALVHNWCWMCCATAVQPDIFGFYRRPKRCITCFPRVHVSLSLSHPKFKNVCKHTCQHTKKQLPLTRSPGAKGSYVKNANSCELSDMWHIPFVKKFLFNKREQAIFQKKTQCLQGILVHGRALNCIHWIIQLWLVSNKWIRIFGGWKGWN